MKCAAWIGTVLFLTAGAALAQTPTPAPLCGTSPASGCHPQVKSGEGQLLIKNTFPDSKDSIRWEWWEGASTTLADLGDPVTSTRYAFCLYDQTGGGLIWSAEIPAGGTCAGRPCWKIVHATYVYKDRNLAVNGVRRLRLRPGADGEARITLSAKGAATQPVTPVLPPVKAQMVNSLGQCWESNYSIALDNSAWKYRDIND